MKELHLSGWLLRDEDGILALQENKDDWFSESIMDSIWNFADDCLEYEDDGLGGRSAIIPKAGMRIYATTEKCSIDDAVVALLCHLYGEITTDIGYEGYSEWTITGYYCKHFTIGGHNLDEELNQYIGKYVHFVIQCE